MGAERWDVVRFEQTLVALCAVGGLVGDLIDVGVGRSRV